MQATFGQDTGLNNEGKTCQCSYGSSSNVPIATYTPGQRICLAFPSKNHVAAKCTSSYIPDNGIVISRSRAGDTSDSFNGRTYKHLNGVHANGQIDHKGFQNCPRFCENMDKALCTLCFDLEADIAPGKYSFKWAWEFNKGQFYTSCWDAHVIGGRDVDDDGRPLSLITTSTTSMPFVTTIAPETKSAGATTQSLQTSDSIKNSTCDTLLRAMKSLNCSISSNIKHSCSALQCAMASMGCSP
jgi:hypothetical protein